MTTSKPPVSSFGGELQATLRQGSNSRLVIEFDDPKMAIRFQARINALRHAMRREDHPDWSQMYRAGVSIDKDNPKRLIIQPKDAEFRDALRKAKVEVPPPPLETRIEVSTPAPGIADDNADSFLSTLTQATEASGERPSENSSPSGPKTVDPPNK